MNVVKTSHFDRNAQAHSARYSIYCNSSEYEFLRRTLNTFFIPFDDPELEQCRSRLLPNLPVKVVHHYLELVTFMNRAL